MTISRQLLRSIASQSVSVVPVTSYTYQNFFTPQAPDEEQQGAIDKMMRFLERVVRDEDYATGKRIQRALPAHAKEVCLFGRNEAGGQRFHRWVDALLETDDAGLAELLRVGVDADR